MAHGRRLPGYPESAAYLHSHVTPGFPLEHEGVAFMIDRLSRKPFPVDFLLMKQDEEIDLEAVTIMLTGLRGKGKSTWAKIFCMEMSVIGSGLRDLTIQINDGKQQEYAMITEWFGHRIIPIKEMQFNCFDPKMLESMAEVIDIACEVGGFGKGTPLDSDEIFVSTIAAHMMAKQYRDTMNPATYKKIVRELTLQDAYNYYAEQDNATIKELREFFEAAEQDILDPNERKRRKDMRERMLQNVFGEPHKKIKNDDGEDTESYDYVLANLDEKRFRRAAMNVAQYFNVLMDGPHGKLLGNSSVYDLMSQTMATWDWRDVSETGITLGRALIWKFRTIALIRGMNELVPDIEIDDEDRKQWSNLTYARFKTEFTKTQRAFPTITINSTHSRLDYLTVGSAGSEQRQRALTYLDDVSVYVFAKQSNKKRNRKDLMENFGYGADEISRLVRQRRGQYGVQITDLPLQFAEIVLSDDQTKLVRTDQATDRATARRPKKAMEMAA